MRWLSPVSNYDSGSTPWAPAKRRLAGDDLHLAVDAVDDVERTLEHLALVLGDDTVFAFGQHDAREGADRFLDDVAAGGDHRPGRVRQRLAAPVADQLQRDDRGA